MRTVMLVALCGALAAPGWAQHRGSSGGRSFRSYPSVLPGRSGLGAPQTPGVGLNGLPSFSTGPFQFNCYGCRPARRSRGPAVWPIYGGGFLPSYPLTGPTYAPPADEPPPGYDVPAPPVQSSFGLEIDRLRNEVDQLKEQRQNTESKRSRPTCRNPNRSRKCLSRRWSWSCGMARNSRSAITQ